MGGRKNRKRKSEGFIFPTPIAAVLVLMSVVALIYLWLGRRCEMLEGELKHFESVQADLDRVLRDEQLKWSRMCTPTSIEKALERHGIEMKWPDEAQIIRLDADTVRRHLSEPSEDLHVAAANHMAAVN